MSLDVFSKGLKSGEIFSGITEKQSRLSELRICELAAVAYSALDFAAKMKKNELTTCEILPLLSEELRSTDVDSSHSDFNLPENAERLEYTKRINENLDKAVFCELLCERASEFDIDLSESEILGSAHAEPSFVYVKNAYSDEAYDVLTENIKNARLDYVTSFKEAALAISEDRATYCILPLEEHSARIGSVSELIAAYDLKINRITSVLGFDGTADMKFAMLSGFYDVPSRDAGDDRYLEIRHPADSQTELSDIIFAAAAHGHSIYRLNTYRNIEDGETKMYYSLVLRDDVRDFSATLVYLSLFSEESTVVGIYKNLE